MNLARLRLVIGVLFLATLWLPGCAPGSGQRFAYGYALGSGAFAPTPEPPAFAHYMTPGAGMTTCHSLGGGVVHCF